MWQVDKYCKLVSVKAAGGINTAHTSMAASMSGSVISGRSIRLSIVRSLRARQTVSYSAWTCSQLGCGDMSMPNRRRHSSALATACVFSDFTTCISIFRR